MSDPKSKSSDKGLQYPPPVHIRTLLYPDVAVEYPEKIKQKDSKKQPSLDWLKDADTYEASKQPVAKNDQPKEEDHKEGGLPVWMTDADGYEPVAKKDQSKGQGHKGGSGGLPAWMTDADDYEPKK
ncbi:hypothetical protein GQX73_g10582 [Xylaria multiplex]|uniref:Uncharacterized protein n=1 Tax=Xylaria multiplex TaxID=323545 RepID=A0A7C8IGD5_9PEZI|nr:hypothetical protein GQX73_g10582 [Xylaria multiplex]